MKRLDIILLVLVLAMTGVFAGGASEKSNASNAAAATDGKHYVFKIAATDEAWRPNAVIEAAKRLNAQLASEGSKDTVEVEWELVDDFKNSFPLWIQEKNLPEIIAHKQTIIYKYAQAGYIVDSGYIVNDEVYTQKVPANLRDFGLMDGKYYGIICDTEARFVVVYKPALLALGWTEEQIATWRQSAIEGKVTTADLQNLAKQVVDAGITQYGITTRPNSGADWTYFYATWNGGKIPQNEKGQNVVSRKAVIDALTFYRKNVQMGITPYNMLTDFNWDMLEGDIWPNGKSFAWYGIVATKSDCMNASGVSAEYFDDNFISIPTPVHKLGDTPFCGSSPYLWALTTASQKDAKTSEYIRRILDNVLDLDIQLDLSLNHAHMAITDECAQSEEYRADNWMTAANDLVPFMGKYQVSPLREGLQDMYADTKEYFNAVQEAMLKANDPTARSVEAIADDFIKQVTFAMGSGNYILVD
mgnify:CR=1 FL=1